jgi:hypothetical protein
MIRGETADIPMLMLSSEEKNRQRAQQVPAVFLNKNSPTLHTEIRAFFKSALGFGDFIFRMPDGTEVARVSNLREMQKELSSIPDESIFYHAYRNHFSSWLMARSEIMLATRLKPVKASDFSSADDLRQFLVSSIVERRKGRQKGVIAEFVSGQYDPEFEFVKIGKGSLGGKARGLAFMSIQLRENRKLRETFQQVEIRVPQTLVISTEAFDQFIAENELKDLASGDLDDREISRRFLQARLPRWLVNDLETTLAQLNYPLAVRSSSLLEDAQFQPFAGIYRTYMLPNEHPELGMRLQRLIQAIKLVYASTYLSAPRSYANSTMHRIEDEKMAVVIQQLSGNQYRDLFYPTVSGVAQSFNFYPVDRMKPEDGIAHIALGLGKTVVEGGRSLRFCPSYPQLLPQFSTVEDILQNAQRHFYALKMGQFPEDFGDAGNFNDECTLSQLAVDEAVDHPAVRRLSSTYSPEEHRIRDVYNPRGYPVLTFAGLLKYGQFPLGEILQEILEIGKKGMGCPVEIEFSLTLRDGTDPNPEFSLLQIRPMATTQQNHRVEISESDIEAAFCYSTMALGNGLFEDIVDLVYVRPETFDPALTVRIAGEIGTLNHRLTSEQRKYLLIGPGRWGSADRWLGIPVTWKDISGVGAIVETTAENLKADPSQGSHFFHNITSLGISYLNVRNHGRDFIDWNWITSLPAAAETDHLRHVWFDHPITIKIDGKTSRAVVIQSS